MIKKAASVLFVLIFFCGCASTSGANSNPPKYNPKTGTYQKTYTTGELGGHFVKDLLGIGTE